MEILDYYKEMRRRKKDKSEGSFEDSSMGKSIDILLSEALQIDMEYVEFEVREQKLPAVISAIDKKPLIEKYNIQQIDGTLFRASLKDIDY